MGTMGIGNVRRVRGLVIAGAVAAVMLGAVASAEGRGVYVLNYNANTISSYTVGSDGSLSPVGSPVSTAGQPYNAAIDPSGKYMYVTNTNARAINQYSIGSDGSLSPLSPPTAAGGISTKGIAITPSGKYAVVGAYYATVGTMDVYSIGSGGQLTKISQRQFYSLNSPRGVAIHPTGNSLYVASQTDAAVYSYSIDSAGQLVPLTAALPTGTSPKGMTVHPSGKAAYVSQSGANFISQYSIDAGTGNLSAMPSATVSTGATQDMIAVSPSGANAYATLNGAGSVGQFSIDQSTYALSPLTPSSVVLAGSSPDTLAVFPSGDWTYSDSAGEGSVYQFSNGSGGALSALAPPTVAAGSGAGGIAIQPAIGPTTALSVTPVVGGADVFDASDTAFADMPVVKTYEFDFGDGTAPISITSPSVTYEYSKPGTYAVTTTVSSDGCSTGSIYGGQMAYCTGSQAADFSRNVVVTLAPNNGGTVVVPGNAGQTTADGAAIPANDVALRLRLSGKAKQKLRAGGIAVKAECENSDCTVVFGGRTKVAGKTFALKTAEAKLERGQKKTVHIAFASSRSYKAIKKLLGAKNKQADVEVQATATGGRAAASTAPEKSHAKFRAKFVK